MIASADRRHTLASCDSEETLCTNTEAIFTQDTSSMWEIITSDFQTGVYFHGQLPVTRYRVPCWRHCRDILSPSGLVSPHSRSSIALGYSSRGLFIWVLSDIHYLQCTHVLLGGLIAQVTAKSHIMKNSETLQSICLQNWNEWA